MAFPSSVGTKQDDLFRAWEWIRGFATTVKTEAQQLRAASLAGPTDMDTIVRFTGNLADAKSMLSRAVAVAGILPYVRQQINDPDLDIAAEYTAMASAIDGTLSWITTNFPKDSNDYLLYHKFNAEGRLTVRTLSSAQTAGLRTQLDTLIGTIN